MTTLNSSTNSANVNQNLSIFDLRHYGIAYLVAWIPFLVLFPLWFFRYSRSLWLAMEFYLNPEG